MALSLTTAGSKVDAFPSAFAGWTKEYSGSLVPAISSGKLNFSNTGAYDSIYSFDAAGSSVGDCMATMDLSGYSQPAGAQNYAARLVLRTGGTNALVGYVFAYVSSESSAYVAIIDQTSGSAQVGSNVSVAAGATSMGAKVTGTGTGTRLTIYINGSPVTGLTDVTPSIHANDTGKAAFYLSHVWTSGTQTNHQIDNYTFRTRANVLVTSLPAGWYARLTDGTNVVDASASSGTATITPSTAQGFGPWTLRIYNGDPTGAGSQQGSDQTGVYGGDSWAGSFATTAVVSDGTATAIAPAGILQLVTSGLASATSDAPSSHSIAAGVASAIASSAADAPASVSIWARVAAVVADATSDALAVVAYSATTAYAVVADSIGDALSNLRPWPPSWSKRPVGTAAWSERATSDAAWTTRPQSPTTWTTRTATAVEWLGKTVDPSTWTKR
jgi:hypothetical protein